MPNRKIHLALLTGLVLAPAIAFAADAPGGRPDMPRGPGMRGGMMTPEIINLAFSALDTNKDGKISKEEFEANRPTRIQMADANKDGTVSKKEYEKFVVERARQHADQVFARLDRNNDGKIDSEDTKMMAEARFDRLDANHDGVITKDEFAPRGAMARRDRDRHFRGPRPDHGVTTE